MIVNVIWTMFLFRGAAAAGEEPAEHLPYGAGAFASQAVGKLFDGHERERPRGARGRRAAPPHRRDARVPRHRAELQAPAHLRGAAERALRPPPGRPGRGQAAHLGGQAGHPRRHRRPGREHHARHRLDRGLLLEGHARLRDLHRVRTLPVAVPRVEHREAALSQDADHEPPRPRVREGAVPPGRRGRSGLAAAGRARRGRPTAGRRDRGAGLGADGRRRSSTPTCCGRA